MDWLVMIIKLCDLRDELRLLDDYDPGHPVFAAIDRTHPGMTKADWQYADNVVGYYRELLDLRRLDAVPVPSASAHALRTEAGSAGSEVRR